MLSAAVMAVVCGSAVAGEDDWCSQDCVKRYDPAANPGAMYQVQRVRKFSLSAVPAICSLQGNTCRKLRRIFAPGSHSFNTRVLAAIRVSSVGGVATRSSVIPGEAQLRPGIQGVEGLDSRSRVPRVGDDKALFRRLHEPEPALSNVFGLSCTHGRGSHANSQRP
jgi:hypothetical protein